MEIIVTGKQYRNLVNLSETRKKIIFYNENCDILIYHNIGKLCLPTVLTSEEEEFFSKLNKITGISFQWDSVDHFLQLQDYSLRLKRQNNKLIKIYLETIRDYYCCPVNMEKKIEVPIEILGDGINPTFMNLEDILTINSQPNSQFYSRTNEGLKIFKQKLKEREYGRKKV
ncbi:MAG: hypothetical protein HFJ12_07695 [Bacilli bacterium]|nr:hypothetical protein [Bacilli bacterium]